MKQKKLYIEILRIIAIAFVIFNHTGKNGFQLYSITDNEIMYVIYLTMAVICKIAVPIFFMVSGALLLNKEESIKDLYKRRVSRIVLVILIASFIQYLWQKDFDIEKLNIKVFFKTIYSKEMIVPYWFLYTYLAFLISLPFLRNLVKNMRKEHFYYLFVLYIIYQLFVPIINEATGWTLNNRAKIGMFSLNIIAPIVGYFCENIMKKEKINKKTIIFGTIGTIIIIIVAEALTIWKVRKTGNATIQTYLNYGDIFIATYVYMMIKYIFENKKIPKFLERTITIIGSCSFGVYLWELNIREVIFAPMIKTLTPIIKAMPACIITIICVISIGTIITMILKKIPYVKKLL